MEPTVRIRSEIGAAGKRRSRAFVAFTIVSALLLLAAAASAGPVSPEALMGKLKWRSVGPYIGGRVVAVTGVPGTANLFYMGGVGGGIWKSTDYGITWKNISDGKLPGSSPSIGALAVAPSDPKIIYAGTGESDIRTDMIPGDGIFKSTDGGKTWHYAGLGDTHTISAVAVDPKNPDIVYASSMGHVFKPNAERGVFKSTDGGQTWNKVLFVNDETGAIDLVMEPNDPHVLYAAMWQATRTPWSLSSGGPGSGLYKSTDGGAHWTNLTRNDGFPQGVLGRIGVSVTASNPDVVYTIVQAKHGGVFRSDDGGKSWKRVNAEWKLRQRAFYYMSIFADPKDPNTVYAPEVDALWVSRDGGKTFKKLKTPHGDNHIVWINPDDPQIMLEGNDGGATVTTNGGKTWSTEHNQPTGQFYHVNLDDQFPYHIYGAQQDEGSFEGPSAASGGSIPLSAWHRVAYGESTYSVPQPGNPNITYGSGYFSIFMRYDMATGQYEGISPWPDYQEGASSLELKYRFGWTHPILFSPTDPKELLIGSQYVLKSNDYGKTWQRISPDLTRNVPSTEMPSGGPVNFDQSGAEIYPSISALAVSPMDGSVIWAGSDDGLLHVTTDGGKTWQAVNPPGLPEHSWISSIQPSYTARGTAYFTTRRYMWDDFRPYVFKTTDFGKDWTALTTGLPDDSYVFAIRQDPKDPNLLFLGTKSTVYVSLDAGAHWQPLTLNLPLAQVRDIAINTRQGNVVIATHGRSFWVLDNLSLLEQLTKNPAVQSDGAFLFAPEQAWLTHAYGKPDEGFKPSDSGQNPPFGATVFFNVPAGYDGKTPVTIDFTDAQGQVVRKFDLHLKKHASAETNETETPEAAAKEAKEKLTAIEPGMNRFQWDLRYASAAEVKGFQPPVPAGGLPDTVAGPTVVPGTYSVVLDYGGQTTRQSLDVALDPRLHASQAGLAARLALELKIHGTLDTLDRAINQAIAARDKLKASVEQHHLTEAQAGPAIASLDREIRSLVQLDIKSSEGSLVHETKLRSHLAYLAADVGLAYRRPNAAEYAVFEYLDQKAKAGEQKLDAAIAEANKVR
ncbi:MAG TPA: exo-alpha-sialidase [Candidatus Limnocylindrales bacterium]|nr:exo-alpha-sialidase [Candidatus Limnocylindrales bacterium]